MSHPLRVRILAMLDESTASPMELAGWLGAFAGAAAPAPRAHARAHGFGEESASATRVRGAVEHHYKSVERAARLRRRLGRRPRHRQAGRRLRLPADDRRLRPRRQRGRGFDHGNFHLTRTPGSRSTLAAGATSARACACVCSTRSTGSRRPTEERIERNPHSGGTRYVARSWMMLFEAARLRRRDRGRPGRGAAPPPPPPRHVRSSPDCSSAPPRPPPATPAGASRCRQCPPSSSTTWPAGAGARDQGAVRG